MNDSAKTIGKKLRDLRIKNKETLSEVAEACGITKSALGNYETGLRIPRDDRKIALAKHYNTSVESIFFES